jgi:Flp pilus assembly protein TadG
MTLRRKRSRAQSLVEFALVVPLFLGLTLLTVEAGRLVVVWSLLLEASREATRTAILPATNSSTTIVNNALQLTGWFGTTAAEVTVFKNGTPVTGGFTKQRGDTVSVRIVHTHHIVFVRPLGFAWPGLPFQAVTIPVQTHMRAEG